ncbi:MAG TPA: FecR domain-containing protein [Sphingobium sp.]|uniref:FecR family protein n=1 Tax=Sphingobium sp. TaxID=1912891 RepID=UPI002ED36E6E
MQDPILSRAIEWHVRLRDGADEAWEAFAQWLSDDPRHPAAYDEVARMDEQIEPFLPELAYREPEPAQPANDVMPLQLTRRRFGLWVSGAIAASIAAVLVIGSQLGSQTYEIATGVGETRVVQIDATTTIALNGATKLLLDHKNPRFASLLTGQALFHVRHDADKRFVLEVGQERVIDVGTVFDVVRSDVGTRVAVAEGSVEYRGKQQTVPLNAGEALLAPRDGDLQVSRTTAAAVGAWRENRLIYSGAPLTQVATDLSRSMGLSIRVHKAIANRPFSGNLIIGGEAPEVMRRLAIALDVRMVRQGNGWLMVPADRAPR